MKTSARSQVFRFLLSASLGFAPLAGHSQAAHDSRVDLGGYKLFVSEAGVGQPTVVFESGLGEDVSTWTDVQPKIASFTHTFTYDRAGLDKSDPSPQPRTVENLASELHTLLHAAKVPSPYILVGHSLGGAIVELFAFTYPTEVAGLVLVDPEDGRLIDLLHSKMPEDQWQARHKAIEASMPQLSETQKAELKASDASGDVLAHALPLPNVPIVLLTGTLKDPNFPGNPLEQDLKLDLHNNLLAHLPQARHVLVPQSRHYIQNEVPELVIQAIHEVAGKPSDKSPSSPAH